MADGRKKVKNKDGSYTYYVQKGDKWVKDESASSSSKNKTGSGSTSKDTANRIKDLGTMIDAGKGQVDNILGKDFTLGRVDEELSPEQKSIIEAAGRDYLGAGINNTGQSTALSHLADLAATAGTRSADTADLLDRSKNLVNTAGTLPADVALALEKMKSGLGGLTSEENTALYESLMGEVNRSFQGAQRDIAASGAASGVANPSLLRTAADDYLRGKIEGAQKVLVANADIQDRRLGAFGDYADSVNQNAFTRSRDALDLYGKNLTGIETNEFNQKLASGQAYNSATEANVVNNRNDQISRLGLWGSLVDKGRADNLARVTTNMNSLAGEIAAKTGIVLGIPQYIMGDRASSEANRIAEKAVDKSGGGGTGRSSGGTSAPVAQDSFDTPQGFASGNTVSSVNNGRI